MIMDDLYNKKILIVDDEQELRKLVENALYQEGFYHVHLAKDGKEALAAAISQPISLYLLDVNLPDIEGFALYEKLRTLRPAPVIFLTARGEGDDRIRGLNLGADDYIVKPFLLKELILRVKAVLRRVYRGTDREKRFHLGNRTVDLAKAAILLEENTEYPLTAKELTLIEKLWENKNRIVTNDALTFAAWGEDYYGHENTLRVHMRRLRQKLEEDPSHPQYLLTAKGLGYKLVIGDA